MVLISIDTLRADHLSCYGYGRITTPNLDNLGEDGVVYENAYSTAAWTAPAHASMLTGLYPSCHGVVDNCRLSEDIPTLAEILLENGYKTAGFVNNSQVGELVGLGRGHETFIEVWRGTRGDPVVRKSIKYLIRNAKEFMGISDHGADCTNRLVRQWIARNKSRHFYVFIHYVEPHNPINAPYPFKNKYWDKKKIKNIDRRKLRLVAHNPLVCFTDNIRLNEDEINGLKALYDGEVSYMDQKIGEVVEYLKSEGVYDNTLIIVTADHGEHFDEHGLYSHVASLYEPIVHVPLIMKYPAWASKRGRVGKVVQVLDICCAVVEAAGIGRKFLSGAQGRSLAMADVDGRCRDYVVAEWEGRVPYFVLDRMGGLGGEALVRQFREPMVMIRKERYKLIRRASGKEELYDVERDRGELNNIREERREIAGVLSSRLSEWESVNSRVKRERRGAVDGITRKNLESLGYM
ncbi:MAG: sulfatase [Candidatus Methylomirabilales bacterium]